MEGPRVESRSLERWLKERAEPCAWRWRSFVFAGPAESVTWAQRATIVSPAIQFTSAFAVESFFEVASAFLYARASVKTSLGRSSASESAKMVYRVETACGRVESPQAKTCCSLRCSIARWIVSAVSRQSAPVAQGLHFADLAQRQRHLDPRADEGVGARALPRDPRPADEDRLARGLVQLHRIALCRDVAAVDRDPAAPPHPVVPLEAHPVSDDDVRLAAVGVRAVLDRGPGGRVQFQRVANSPRRPVIGHVRSPEHGPRLAVHGHDVHLSIEALQSQEVRCALGVERDRRVADVHRALLPDHVEPPDPCEPRHAVGRQRAPRPLAVGEDATAREHVGLPLAHFDLLGLAAHRVDHHRAGPAAGGVGGRLLDEGEEEHRGDHWFGSVNFPPVPLGRIAVTTLKSGSDVNPSPSTWRFGSSNTNGLSEVTSFLAWK